MKRNLEIETGGLGFFHVDEKTVVFEPEKPMRYKASGKDGHFYRGASNRDIGTELAQIQPIHYIPFTGKLYKTKDENTDWCELIFIDGANCVSSMLLKTESLDKFKAVVKEAYIYDKVQLHQMSLTAKLVERTSKDNDKYYAIEWHFKKATPEKSKIAEDFLTTQGKSGLYNIYTMMEFAIKQKIDNVTSVDECTKDVLLKAALKMGMIKELPAAKK